MGINRAAIKCPNCGESYFTESYSTTTAMYYPPGYKNGININPDRNITTTTCYCKVCGKTFNYQYRGSGEMMYD